jgi:hypothetical protein
MDANKKLFETKLKSHVTIEKLVSRNPFEKALDRHLHKRKSAKNTIFRKENKPFT